MNIGSLKFRMIYLKNGLDYFDKRRSVFKRLVRHVHSLFQSSHCSARGYQDFVWWCASFGGYMLIGSCIKFVKMHLKKKKGKKSCFSFSNDIMTQQESARFVPSDPTFRLGLQACYLLARGELHLL